MTDRPVPVLRSTVYGSPDPDLEDPAEAFHEASKLYPALPARAGAGIARLAADTELQAAVARAVRRNRQRASVRLVPRATPAVSLWDAIAARRSGLREAPAALEVGTLATVLASGYGASGEGRRAAPSGGALYPLELYVVARTVNGLAPGVFHVDPLRRALESLDDRDPGVALADALPLPELAATAAAAVFVTAVFWRTRFKYGLRGYRFALLEAGHLAQNLLLAAAALGLPALPLGGFYDARIERLLGVDGVDESVLYGVLLGGEAE